MLTGGCVLGTTGSNFEARWGVLDTYWMGLVTQNFTWDLLQLTCSYIHISYIFYVLSYHSIPHHAQDESMFGKRKKGKQYMYEENICFCLSIKILSIYLKRI